MPTPSTPPAASTPLLPLPDSDQRQAERIMLERSEADIRKLIEGMRDSGNPQLLGLIDSFQRELHASTSRTIETFTALPTVQQALASWADAGLAKNDILFLMVDVAALIDARVRLAHEDQARMTGLVGGAVLAVAQVYAAAADEGVKVRLELNALRGSIEQSNEINVRTMRGLETAAAQLGAVNQANYELTNLIGRHEWTGRLYLGLGAAGIGVFCLLIGMLISKLFL